VIAFLLKESKPKTEEILVPEEGTIRKVFSQECKECYSTTIDLQIKREGLRGSK
jgi:hypothetical protein